MVILMGKRFYVVLFSALCISLLLLGFSFSKESGTNDIRDTRETNAEDYRVIYSNNQRLNTKDNNLVDISIINKSPKKNNFYLYLNEINNTKYNDIYYSINNGIEHQLISDVIELGELNNFGSAKDYSQFTIKIRSINNNKYEFKLDVKTTNKNFLENKIINSKNIYTDKENNVRFYGENVNNYLIYNNETYRIIGVINNKIKIISNGNELGPYSPSENNYLTINDYVKSFAETDIEDYNEIKQMKSWLSTETDFWLLDTIENNAYYASLDNGIATNPKKYNYYIRNTYELDKELLVINGDGTENNPYEVSYGS